MSHYHSIITILNLLEQEEERYSIILRMDNLNKLSIFDVKKMSAKPPLITLRLAETRRARPPVSACEGPPRMTW